MPSCTVLISGRAVGAVQILIRYYSCVFLCAMWAAIRTSAFCCCCCFGELSMTFYIFQKCRLCLVDHVDLVWILYSWGEGFGSSSITTLPWVSTVVLFPPLHVGCPLGFAPEAALEALGLPLWGPGVEVGQLLQLQGFWQHQVLRGVGD